MLRWLFFLCFTILLYFPSLAQNSGEGRDTVKHPSHLRISLLTCGPGAEVWETFGHSAIRITDSTKTGRARDVVYNFGFVESSEDNTVMHQFLTRRVIVFLATNTFDEFKYQYTDEKRRVEEQELLLNDQQKERIVSYLDSNLRKDSRYYEYSAIDDNCSTRILNMFRSVLGKSFVPGQVIPPGSRITFRDIAYSCGPEYKQHKYWYAIWMRVFFGSRLDRTATNLQAMYQADYLRDGMAGATLAGKKVCPVTTMLFEETLQWPPDTDEPFLLFLIVATLTIAGLLVKKLRWLGKALSFLILFITGLAGWCVLYLWMINGEPGWKDNYAILWLLPTNVFIVFFNARIKAMYAVAALLLLGVSFILHIGRVQELPLVEGWPLLLALVFIYGMLYRNGTTGRKGTKVK